MYPTQSEEQSIRSYQKGYRDGSMGHPECEDHKNGWAYKRGYADGRATPAEAKLLVAKPRKWGEVIVAQSKKD